MLGRGIQLTRNSFWEDTENVNQLAAITENNFFAGKDANEIINWTLLLRPVEVTQNTCEWASSRQREQRRGKRWNKQAGAEKGVLWLWDMEIMKKIFQSTSTKVVEGWQTALCRCSSKALNEISDTLLYHFVTSTYTETNSSVSYLLETEQHTQLWALFWIPQKLPVTAIYQVLGWTCQRVTANSKPSPLAITWHSTSKR